MMKYQENLKYSWNHSPVLSLPPKMKILSILAKIPWKIETAFPVVNYFTWKLEFLSNILSMIVDLPDLPLWELGEKS